MGSGANKNTCITQFNKIAGSRALGSCARDAGVIQYPEALVTSATKS